MMNPIYSLERLEPRRLLSGDVVIGDIIPIQTASDFTVYVRAGEFGVLIDPDNSPAGEGTRSPELPPDAWLADAMAELADDSIVFERYLGLEKMFSITAPVTMDQAQVEQLLADAVPGFVATDRNYVGKADGFAPGDHGTAAAGSVAIGDIITISDGDVRVRARAGEFTVALGEYEDAVYDGGAGSPADESPRSPEVAPDAWLADVLAPLAAAGIEFQRYDGLDSMFTVTAPVHLSLNAVEQMLSVVPGLLAVGRNYVGTGDLAPNDPLYDDQWHLNNTGQVYSLGSEGGFAQGTPGADVDAEDAWDRTVGGFSTVVAVLDSGMQYDHEDLTAPRWRNQLEDLGNSSDDDNNGYVNDAYGYDFVSIDRDPYAVPGGPFSPHGTTVAGSLGAHGDNGLGVSGMAQRVRILPLRVMDPFGNVDINDATAAINYVNTTYDAGANIETMNMSFSIPVELVFEQEVESMYLALSESQSRSIVAVTSSGNRRAGGLDLDEPFRTLYPQSFGLDNIISVAATDDEDKLASFSNFGAMTIDVAAPGQSIWTTSYTTDAVKDEYDVFSGTSFSSPIVAGLVSLAYAIKPNFDDVYGIQNMIDVFLDPANSDPDPTLSGKVGTGGRINAEKVLADVDPGYDAIAYGDFGGMRLDDEFVVRPVPGDPSTVEVWWFDNELNEVDQPHWEIYLTMENDPAKTLGIFTFAGRDTILVEAGVEIEVYADGGRGNDTIDASGQLVFTPPSSGGGQGLIATAVAVGPLQPGDDGYDGATNRNKFLGGDGNDLIYGSTGGDAITGGIGRDTLYGESGSDFFFAQDGELDSVFGGDDDDFGFKDDDEAVWDVENTL